MLILLISPLAAAEFYLGLEYSKLDVDFKNTGNANAIGVVGGAPINEYLSIEARTVIGTSSASKDDIDIYYGAFARADKQYGQYYPYALLGYTYGKATDKDNNQGSESDVSYGAGVGYSLFDNASLGVQYIRYMDKGELSVDGFSLIFLQHY